MYADFNHDFKHSGTSILHHTLVTSTVLYSQMCLWYSRICAEKGR